MRGPWERCVPRRDVRGAAVNAEAYRPMIMRTIRATANALDATLVAEDVEDFAQDTLLALWEKQPREPVECEWAYARKTARNVTVDGLRRRDAKKRGHRRTESLDQVREPAGETASFEEGLLILDELDRIVRGWRRQLSRRAFNVLYLRTVAGLSSGETAHVLGMTVNAVDSHMHRARRVIGPATASSDDESVVEPRDFEGDSR